MPGAYPGIVLPPNSHSDREVHGKPPTLQVGTMFSECE